MYPVIPAVTAHLGPTDTVVMGSPRRRARTLTVARLVQVDLTFQAKVYQPPHVLLLVVLAGATVGQDIRVVVVARVSRAPSLATKAKTRLVAFRQSVLPSTIRPEPLLEVARMG